MGKLKSFTTYEFTNLPSYQLTNYRCTHLSLGSGVGVGTIGPCHVLLPLRSTSSSQYCTGPASAGTGASDHVYVRPPADMPRPDPISAVPGTSDDVIRTRLPRCSRYNRNPTLSTS